MGMGIVRFTQKIICLWFGKGVKNWFDWTGRGQGGEFAKKKKGQKLKRDNLSMEDRGPVGDHNGMIFFLK